MGYELRRMIRDGAPAHWTGPMVHVASEIADSVWTDPSQELDGSEAPPISTIPIAGCFDGNGRWRDGLAERTGMSARAVSRALTDLAAAGYEMRVIIGKTEDGRPVYAAKGHAVRFVVPKLPPRPVPQSSPSTASFSAETSASGTESTPSTASKRRPRRRRSSPSTARKDAQYGEQSAPKDAVLGEPISPKAFPSVVLPDSTSVDGGSVEGATPTAGQDHFQPSMLVAVPGGSGEAWKRPSRFRDDREVALQQVAEARARRRAAEGSAAS